MTVAKIAAQRARNWEKSLRVAVLVAATGVALAIGLSAPAAHAQSAREEPIAPGNIMPPDTNRPHNRTPDDRAPDDRTPDDRAPHDRTPDSRGPDSRGPDNRLPNDRQPPNNYPDERLPGPDADRSPDRYPGPGRQPDNRPPRYRPDAPNPAPVNPNPERTSPARPRPGSDPVTRLPNPKSAVVIIWNHGTNRPQYRHICNRQRDIPLVIRQLGAAQGWHIHYLCSNAIDGGVRASYTYKRAREIFAVIAAYRAQGVPGRRIISAGHSAGAWSSLIAARQNGKDFGGVIAFAPAFAGPRYEEQLYPAWRRIELPKQQKFIGQAARLNALVFAYPNDAFNRPRELTFLTRISGVRLVPVLNCRGDHGTTYTRCLADQTRFTVQSFVRKTIGQTAAQPR